MPSQQDCNREIESRFKTQRKYNNENATNSIRIGVKRKIATESETKGQSVANKENTWAL
jgi:hypothetical protein